MICPVLDTSLFPNFSHHGFVNPYVPKAIRPKKKIIRRRTADNIFKDDNLKYVLQPTPPSITKTELIGTEELNSPFLNLEPQEEKAQPEHMLKSNEYQKVQSRKDFINLLNLKDAMNQRTTLRANLELLSKISEEEVSSEGDFEFPEVKHENEQFIKYYQRNTNKAKTKSL